jgi:hypothetical protein
MSDPGSADRPPSIKGAAFESVVADLKGLLESGALSREDLEARLRREDLAYLDDKIGALWYPIETYARMVEVLFQVEGRGRTEYLVKRGARAAERLFALGIYRQLQRADEYGQRLRAGAEMDVEREGNLMATIANAMWSVSRWHFSPEADRPGRYRIEVSEARALPECARHAAQGFIQYMVARITQADVLVTSERPAPDLIQFKIQVLGRPG